MARALLVRPAGTDAGRMVQLLESAGVVSEVVDRLDPARLADEGSPPVDLVFLETPPENPERIPGIDRTAWVLIPRESTVKAESFCREWGAWLVDDPLRRQALLRRVIRSVLEVSALKRALGGEDATHAVDDLWFPILERLRRRSGAETGGGGGDLR